MRDLTRMPTCSLPPVVNGLDGQEPRHAITVRPNSVALTAVVYGQDGTPRKHPDAPHRLHRAGRT